MHTWRVGGTALILAGALAATWTAVQPELAGAVPASLAEPTLVVAVDGDDAAPGTVDQPLATVQAAVDRAGPGDVIAVREGTYALVDDNITITTSGTAEAPITLGSYPGERAVIDGEQLPASHTPVGGSIPREERGAIHQEASHWRLQDLEIVNGPYGVYCDGCNDNVFSGLTTRENYESGFQLQGASSRNLITGLDSYGNRDPRKNGESADGLAIKEGSGEGNRVVGARLWNNVDDGFDAWEFTSPIEIEDSLAYGNGFNRWDLPDFSGDGNGYKLGGGGPAAGHTLSNSVAFDNAARGIIDNGNAGALAITHCTTFANARAGFDTDTEGSAATLTANLAVAEELPAEPGGATSTGNSWDLGGEWDESSVLSTDPAEVTGPRGSDGAIPSSDFLVPSDGTEIGARF